MEYGESSIKSLTFPENVQKYVGMYLGGRDENGKLHTIEEILINSVDEYAAGYGKKIDILIEHKPLNEISPYYKNLETEVEEYEYIRIKDRGRGIPIDVMNDGTNTLTYILTNLHTGGKIRGEKTAYVASGGLHGVGASVVLATSLFFEVIVVKKSKNKVVRQIFEKGYAKTPVEEITPEYFGSDKKEFLIVENYDGKLDLEEIQKNNPDKYVIENGTIITWIPWDKKSYDDYEGIFIGEPININKLKNKLDELAYLNPDLILELNYYNNKFIYEHKNGIEGMLEDKLLNQVDKKNIILEKLKINVFLDNKGNTILNYNEEEVLKIVKENLKDKTYKFFKFNGIFSFVLSEEKLEKYYVNNINTKGGIEKKVIKESLEGVLEELAIHNDIVKSGEKVKFSYLDNIYNCIVNLKINDPEFQGQIKEELINPEVGKLLKEFLIGNKNKIGYFYQYFEKKLDTVKNIISVLKEIEKLEKKELSIYNKLLKEKLNKKEVVKINYKLADCKSNDNTKTELFICEGDSAMGPIKNARDPNIQAVLPVSGKIKNVLKEKNMNEILNNNDIGNIITALGCGVGKELDLSKLKYNKIILLSDADDDGYHITSLLLVLFFKLFKKVIEEGHLYVGVSPLYEVTNIKTKKKIYLYNIDEYEEFLEKYKDKLDKFNIKRNKGLGEMNPSAMWESTLNPDTRKLIKVNIEDEKIALENIKLYMSDEKKYKEERKNLFIQKVE